MHPIKLCSLLAPLLAAACARGPAETTSAVAAHDEAELHTRFLEPATGACRAVAIKAVKKLEGINGWNRPIAGVYFVNGHSDRELLRVVVNGTEGALADSYLVNTESLGGDPCHVYGLSLQSESQSLDDAQPMPGIDQGGTSDSCKKASKKAIQALEGANGYGVQILVTSLIAAHSDREILTVKVKRTGGGAPELDTYVVNAETYGGDPCMIYGLQRQSQAIDIGGYDSPEDMLTTMAVDYELAGKDNNYAASLLVKKSDERVAGKLDEIVALESANEVRAALKDCVFMTKGAYGEHISADTQDYLAERYTFELMDLATTHMLSLGKQSFLAADGDIINSPCSLTIGRGDDLLILDAHSFD